MHMDFNGHLQTCVEMYTRVHVHRVLVVVVVVIVVVVTLIGGNHRRGSYQKLETDN